jgi:polyisoprenyl-phosphate glycosyltransferase
VIPVYNSAQIVGHTIDRTVGFFETSGLDYELIIVNDGSRDRSWEVVRDKAGENPRIKAINLLRNSGQHTAILCGLQHSSGDYVVTLDDDLQNPPEEIQHLINKAAEGHDLVFGKFYVKQHGLIRRLGSWTIGMLNRWMFGCSDELTVSNFRLIRRDVVDRICAYRTTYPYITGLSLMLSARPANAMVEHHPRLSGKSSYNIVRLLKLVLLILFNYSVFPLRVVSIIGLMVTTGSLMAGLYFLNLYFRGEVGVPGWISLFLALLCLNGLAIIMISMIGEYMIRLLMQTQQRSPYYIQESINLAPEPS